MSDLKASSSIGSALPLECQIHHTEVFVKTARDFRSKVPHGGCQRPCKVRLKCGHACKKLCHPDDIDHEVYRCGEPCHRTIKGCTHLCPKLCCEECEKYCRVLVEKTLPLCGHVAKVCCGKDPDRVTCTTQCKKTLPCGHRCQEKCGKPCTKQCRELVKKCDWPCRHDVTVACSAEPTDCPFRCLATLECSHQCSGACGECRMGRVHKRCGLRCGRVLVCSHVCREACVMPCPPCPRSCENRCVHSECRPKKCGEPCVPCLENARGNVVITSVTNSVETFVTDQGATNVACVPCLVEAVIDAMFAVVCAESHVYVKFEFRWELKIFSQNLNSRQIYYSCSLRKFIDTFLKTSKQITSFALCCYRLWGPLCQGFSLGN